MINKMINKMMNKTMYKMMNKEELNVLFLKVYKSSKSSIRQKDF